MDQKFLSFIAGVTGVNTWNIVYVEPTPLFKDDKLFLTFVILSDGEDTSRRRRRDSDGST